MLAAISPADYNYDETLGTLRREARVVYLKNVAVLPRLFWCSHSSDDVLACVPQVSNFLCREHEEAIWFKLTT